MEHVNGGTRFLPAVIMTGIQECMSVFTIMSGVMEPGRRIITNIHGVNVISTKN